MAQNPSSRQKIRKVLLILTFILVPVTIFFISPIILMMGASEGIATGAFILVILLFLLSFVVGRLWCGWCCPMGAWQEICSPVTKRTVPAGWPNWIKYIVTVLWLGMIGFAFRQAGGILGIDIFYGTTNGISVTSLQTLVMVAAIFAIILSVAFIAGRRGFCRVLCPIAGIMAAGRKIRNAIGWPALRLDADAAKCTGCKTCSRECPMGLDVNGMVRSGEMEQADCILCASCADTCPQGAISYGVKGK
ncbi:MULTISPECIES: 4Fe-4S binding protein [unclassified Methanoregula]|uniref:4Fe-4S binding protein n=1 Tax=unclassified Methanoregula TaxID=2649730 RepID=UPI0009CCC46E|nr:MULTISPECIES: 4Fe-4S binding protein [unclassified Methanoregula]OPX62523.1 MAG: quinol dehydrogenase membrane component [Methanoregula sp. PtaB.Bin085]OPY31622.1 MAG: quinol dehydrogenase membrane component [Methanoregula sp. PtaU1.Bin006]